MAETKDQCIGLVLPGGGARGAYQAGVLKAIAEMSPDGRNPFQVATGVSVGAINCASLANHAGDFKQGMAHLAGLWGGLHADRIYRTDFWFIFRTALHWVLALILGGLGMRNPRYLLDTGPLEDLLSAEIDFDAIERGIKAGHLKALGVTAASYSTNRAKTFFQDDGQSEEWARKRRDGLRTKLGVRHLMGSTALPFIFDTRRIDNEYYGDGSLRLTAPLSPAIHLGAGRILVIGVRDESRDPVPEDIEHAEYPSLGDLAGHVMDALFSDNLDTDIERLCRINDTLSLLSGEQREATPLKRIDIHVIRPSRDIREIARRHSDSLPWTIRMLMRGVGVWHHSGRLPSFLLFESGFCQELVDLGYRDAMNERKALSDFLGFPS